ncbi:UNVERIFIED_CONTAM: hypothetical protein Sangu_3053900 [Sesamum angustifolium]|uniref:Uncharacterized protein n=1 Tax=Sesamum angustifolium TaxID=2727405 RepID=A0AAW2KFN6_9LAMI
MTKEIATFIGNKLGKFKYVDLDGNGEVWGSSVRMRDALDITKLLTRALKAIALMSSRHRNSGLTSQVTSPNLKRPTFAPYNSLQSKNLTPPSTRGAAIFGEFSYLHSGRRGALDNSNPRTSYPGNNPSLVFLAETKFSVRRIELLKLQLDMNGIRIPAVGKSGSLAVFWLKSINVQLQNYSRNHIDMSVELEVGQPVWRFTGIYGELDTSRRDQMWALLS